MCGTVTVGIARTQVAADSGARLIRWQRASERQYVAEPSDGSADCKLMTRTTEPARASRAVERVDPRWGDRYSNALIVPGASHREILLFINYELNRGSGYDRNAPVSSSNSREFAFMANTSSAKKAARQMIRRTEVNKARRSRLKSEVRGVEEAIASGNKSAAQAAMKVAEPLLVRTAQKGVMHKKSASRKVSRLAARVKAMA